MIKIVYGPKGFGKTKIMFDDVNSVAKVAKGNVVFITDKRMNTASMDINIRCCYTEEYGIKGAQAFNGFINGLLAGNSDIEYVFIDGLKRIVGDDLRGGKTLFRSLRLLQKEYKGLNFQISVTGNKEDFPTYISRYIKK